MGDSRCRIVAEASAGRNGACWVGAECGSSITGREGGETCPACRGRGEGTERDDAGRELDGCCRGGIQSDGTGRCTSQYCHPCDDTVGDAECGIEYRSE
jgi:hypothetical protein